MRLRRFLQQMAVGQPGAELAMGQTQQQTRDIGPQAQGAEAGEARILFGRAFAGVDALIANGRLEESVIELGFTQDAVKAHDQIALLAVIQRAINCRKCWTQGGLKGNDGGHS